MLHLHSAAGITRASNHTRVFVRARVHSQVPLHAETVSRKCHIAGPSPESLYPFLRKFMCEVEKTGVNKECGRARPHVHRFKPLQNMPRSRLGCLLRFPGFALLWLLFIFFFLILFFFAERGDLLAQDLLKVEGRGGVIVGEAWQE